MVNDDVLWILGDRDERSGRAPLSNSHLYWLACPHIDRQIVNSCSYSAEALYDWREFEDPWIGNKDTYLVLQPRTALEIACRLVSALLSNNHGGKNQIHHIVHRAQGNLGQQSEQRRADRPAGRIYLYYLCTSST